MRKIIIEVHSNEEVIDLHTNFLLSEVRLFGSAGRMDDNKDSYGNEALADVITLRHDLYGIPGITEAPGLNKYEVTLNKSPAFDWDEIVPKAIEMLMAFEHRQCNDDTIEARVSIKDSRQRHRYDHDGVVVAGSIDLPPVSNFGVEIYQEPTPQTDHEDGLLGGVQYPSNPE